MSQTLTLSRPLPNLRPFLWLLLPLLVLATLFFYPLLLIAEQALRDTRGHLSLGTFWQVMESRRFIGALLNTLQIAVFATLGCLVLGSLMAVILVFIPFPGSQLISRVIDTFIALPTFLITLAFTFIYGSGWPAERHADVAVRFCAAAGGFSLFDSGRDSGGNHRIYAAGHASADGRTAAN